MRWLLFLLSLVALASCAALGIGTPAGRPIPLAVKDSELGRCASSGYEVDVPPHATVATVASVCVRPYVADAGVASELPPRAPPTLSTPIQTFPLRSLPDGGG